MKDHSIDDRALARKFDDETLQLDDAKPSSLLGSKTIGRLVVGLQNKAAFAIQRDAMRYRAALEVTDASRAERGVGAVAGRKACKDDIPHDRLQWRRQTDNVAVTIGQEGDGKPVRQQAVRHLGQFERLVVTVRQGREHAAPAQCSAPLCSLTDITP